MTESQMLLRYEGVARRVVWRLDRSGDDDLLQEARLGMLRAFRGYEEGRCKLCTYLYKVARNAVIDALRVRGRYEGRFVPSGLMDGVEVA